MMFTAPFVINDERFAHPGIGLLIESKLRYNHSTYSLSGLRYLSAIENRLAATSSLNATIDNPATW